MFLGKVERPKASISAVVIKADGTRIDVGTIAGEGRDDPANLEKGKSARARINALLKKEKKEARNGS
jgi:hypothetical protein